MSAGHSHGASVEYAKASPRVRRWLALALAPFAIGIVAGLILLHPQPYQPASSTPLSGDLYDATVVSVNVLRCSGGGQCQAVVIEPSDGPEAGHPKALPPFSLNGDMPAFNVGEGVVVSRTVVPQSNEVIYNYADQQRSVPLAILGALFAVVVVAVARLRGLGALAGLAITYFVVVEFLLPALIDGKNAMLVALVSSGAILFVVLYIAHGFNARTTTALLGTLVSMILIAVLAEIFVGAAHLFGNTSEDATYVSTLVGQIDLQGVLLAGIVIGSLGALNDATVTQASAVWEIHAAKPDRGMFPIYRSGMRIGRDHIASTVYTLVLAYAGASLPLLIIFSLGRQSLARILTGDLVAEEIVRTLVGSIGLVASVPLTTAIAAVVVTRAGRKHDDSPSAAEGGPVPGDEDEPVQAEAD